MPQNRCRKINAVLVIFGFPKAHTFTVSLWWEKPRHCFGLHAILQLNQRFDFSETQIGTT